MAFDRGGQILISIVDVRCVVYGGLIASGSVPLAFLSGPLVPTYTRRHLRMAMAQGYSQINIRAWAEHEVQKAKHWFLKKKKKKKKKKEKIERRGEGSWNARENRKQVPGIQFSNAQLHTSLKRL